MQHTNGETRMLSEEARIGKRVRIRADHPSTALRGLEGTIAKRWGHPDYVALDVLLDDGRLELFWYHELEELAERPCHAPGNQMSIGSEKVSYLG